MSADIENQIKDRIHSFVQELDQLVRKNTLEALHGILAGTATPAARRGRPAGRGRGPGRPKGSGRGSSNVAEAAEKILAHVQANDGQGVSEIAAATGTALPAAKKALMQLLATGALKKTGQKRGTKYHVGSGRAPAGAAKKARKAGKRRKKSRAAKAA